MPNKLYQVDETATTWTDTTGDLAMTLNALGAGAGRQGAVHDFGTSARAFKFAWRAWVKFATTPVVQEYVAVKFKTSDGTHPDNDDGTGDIAISAEDKLRNLTSLGNIQVDEASTTPEFVKSGVVWLPHRYFMPVFWNFTADGLAASNNVSGFSLTPVPPELQ